MFLGLFLFLYFLLTLFLRNLRNRGHHHSHVTPLHTGGGINPTEPFAIRNNPVENFPPLIEEGHLSSPEKDRDLDPVSVRKKILDGLELEIVVMNINLGPHLHFLDTLGLLLTSSILFPLLLKELVLPIIHDPADGRLGVGSNLDKIKLMLICELKSLPRGNNTMLDTLVIDQKNFGNPNRLVHARFVIGLSYSNSPPKKMARG